MAERVVACLIDGEIVPIAAGDTITDSEGTAIGGAIQIAVAAEDLNGGDLVSLSYSAGSVQAEKADALSAGKEAQGFILKSTISGETVPVYMAGMNIELVGLTPGTRYYLSTLAGEVTDTPPSGSGNVVQYVGKAISTTSLAFTAADGVINA